MLICHPSSGGENLVHVVGTRTPGRAGARPTGQAIAGHRFSDARLLILLIAVLSGLASVAIRFRRSREAFDILLKFIVGCQEAGLLPAGDPEPLALALLSLLELLTVRRGS